MVVSGRSSSVPNCLGNLLTLTIPIEHRVERFREAFSHSMDEVRSRVGQLLRRTEEVGHQTSALMKRADNIDREVAEVKRQTSDAERRQEELEQHAVDLEVRTTLLENQEDAANQSLLDEMSVLTEQLEEVKERVGQAEIDATKSTIKCEHLARNSRNRDPLSAKDRDTLLQRLESLEQKVQKFEARFPNSIDITPRRSMSSHY